MSRQEINYAKEALTSNWNYYFIALMVFLMFVTGSFWGWFYASLAGEVGIWLASFTDTVQRIIYLKNNQSVAKEMQLSEAAMTKDFAGKYKDEMLEVSELCNRIEKRAQEVEADGTHLMVDVLDKVSQLRFRFARMLKLHKNLSDDQSGTQTVSLQRMVKEAEAMFAAETNTRVRSSLQSNLTILKKRLTRAKTLGVQIREIEAQLNLAKNSLGLLYDEVRTATDLSDNFSSMVDSIVANLEISESLRDELDADEEIEMRLPVKQTVAKTAVKSSGYRNQVSSTKPNNYN